MEEKTSVRQGKKKSLGCFFYHVDTRDTHGVRAFGDISRLELQDAFWAQHPQLVECSWVTLRLVGPLRPQKRVRVREEKIRRRIDIFVLARFLFGFWHSRWNSLFVRENIWSASFSCTFSQRGSTRMKSRLRIARFSCSVKRLSHINISRAKMTNQFVK